MILPISLITFGGTDVDDLAAQTGLAIGASIVLYQLIRMMWCQCCCSQERRLYENEEETRLCCFRSIRINSSSIEPTSLHQHSERVVSEIETRVEEKASEIALKVLVNIQKLYSQDQNRQSVRIHPEIDEEEEKKSVSLPSIHAPPGMSLRRIEAQYQGI